MNRNPGKYQARIAAGLIVASLLLPIALMKLETLLELESSVPYPVYVMLAGCGTVGLVMMFAAFTKYHHRPKWAFWFMLAYGLLLLRFPPQGTVFGLFTLIYLIIQRKFFFPRKALVPNQ